VQELGRSIARQLAEDGQWKYSMPWTSSSVYKWGLAGAQEPLCHEIEPFCEFGIFSVILANFVKFMSSAKSTSL